MLKGSGAVGVICIDTYMYIFLSYLVVIKDSEKFSWIENRILNCIHYYISEGKNAGSLQHTARFAVEKGNCVFFAVTLNGGKEARQKTQISQSQPPFTL